jgi:hypothetical protein
MDPNVETAAVRKLLTRLPVYYKPDPQWFVQTHPDPAFHVQDIGLLEYRADRRIYVVAPKYSELLKAHYRKHYIFVGITIGGAPFLWAIKMPGEDGSWNAWPSSMYGCASAARTEWLQVQNGGSGWDGRPPESPKPPPNWGEALYPCTDMDELLALAFRQTFIDGDDHPVLVALLGR